MKTFFSYLIALVVLFGVFVGYTWYDFTRPLQDSVSDELVSYHEVAIDWDEIEIPVNMTKIDRKKSMYIIGSELGEVTFLAYSGNKTRDEYRESIYDVVYHVAKGSDTETIKAHMEKAAQMQQEWLDSLEKFSNNTLYAMQFTFW